MRRSTATTRPRPPGPGGPPLIGNTLQWARDPFGFITDCARDHGDIVYTEVAGTSWYRLYHPDHFEHVLIHNNQNYVKGEFLQQFLGALTGQGLLTSEGEFWRRQRHLIQPAFHPDRVPVYASMMTGYADRLIASWEDGETRDIHADMMRLTLEIIASALFEVDLRDHEADIGAALEEVMEYSESVTSMYLPSWLPTPAKRRYERAISSLDEVVFEILDERRSSSDDSRDVVSMLLDAETEDGHRMTETQLRDEVMTLLLAGHETTASALSFTWYLLSKHPTAEANLVAELDAVLGGRTPTLDDLSDLRYTEQVVKESLRLYPPVHSVVREAIEDDEIGGYHIPAGASVAMHQWVTHTDPRFFDDPDAFRPERWTREFEREVHPLAYFPFSAGPRRCIGDRFAMLEAQLVLATIAQRYRLELASESSLDLALSITTRPKGGIEMNVHER